MFDFVGIFGFVGFVFILGWFHFFFLLLFFENSVQPSFYDIKQKISSILLISFTGLKDKSVKKHKLCSTLNHSWSITEAACYSYHLHCIYVTF